jgi:hypothetical protein
MQRLKLLGLIVEIDRVRIVADRAGLLGGILASLTCGGIESAERLEHWHRRSGLSRDRTEWEGSHSRHRRARLSAPLFASARGVVARVGQDQGMEYLVVNSEGSVLAVLESLEDVAREIRRIGRDPHASGRVRVIRHDVHEGEVMGVESFVTASPLPSLRDPRRPPAKPATPRRALRLR